MTPPRKFIFGEWDSIEIDGFPRSMLPTLEEAFGMNEFTELTHARITGSLGSFTEIEWSGCKFLIIEGWDNYNHYVVKYIKLTEWCT